MNVLWNINNMYNVLHEWEYKSKNAPKFDVLFKIKAADSESSNQEEEESGLCSGRCSQLWGSFFYVQAQACVLWLTPAAVHPHLYAAETAVMHVIQSCSILPIDLCVLAWSGSRNQHPIMQAFLVFFFFFLLKGRSFCVLALAWVQHTPLPVWSSNYNFRDFHVLHISTCIVWKLIASRNMKCLMQSYQEKKREK